MNEYLNFFSKIFEFFGNIGKSFYKTVHGTQDLLQFTAKPEGEWISRDGHLKQVFQSNV